MSDTKGYAIEKGAEIVLTAEQYDYLITEDVMPRVTFGDDFLGFYLIVDTAIELIEHEMEDLLTDEEEFGLANGILEKLKPFAGKAMFIP